MIAFLPRFYPDELVYSFIARYHVMSGHAYASTTNNEIFANSKRVIEIEFLGEWTNKFRSIMEEKYSIDYIIKNHTMFYVYTFSFSPEKRKKVYDLIKNNNYEYKKVTGMRYGRSKRHLMYCPICALEDREKYGETYWHRTWIIENITICPEHKCFLNDTNIIMTGDKRSCMFYPAEHCIPQNSKIIECNNDIDLEIARYVSYINLKNMCSNDDLYMIKSIESKLGNTFKNSRGYYDYKKLYKNMKQLYINSLYFDFSEQKLQRLLHEKDYNLIPMCMIAKYFKIPFADLFKQVNKKENDKQIFENKILELRNNNMTFKEIANKLNSNCTTVRRTYYKLKS